jgi:putative peptidoglycan lipid II flippase
LAGVHLTRGWQQAAPLVREVLNAMLPVVLATSITQLNALVDSLLAWGLAAPAAGGTTIGGFAWPLETGTASALYFAQRMYQFPLGVFGVALGTVLFPLLARHTARGELDQVGRDLTLGMRLTLAIGLPASVGLILLREPIAVTLFERGAFTREDSALTARCIAAYSVGVWAYIGLLVIHRGFFAQGDRRTPTRIGLAAVGMNVVLNLTLIWFMAGAGLAFATAIAAIVQFVATAAAYQRTTKLLDLASIGRTAMLTVVATAIMGLACAVAQAWLPAEGSLFDRVMALLGPFAASVGTYLLTARLIGLHEPFLLLRRGSH